MDTVRRVPAVASVDAVLTGYMRSLAARGVTASTIEPYGMRSARVLGVFGELGRVPDTEAVPGTWLTRDRVIELTNHLRARLAPVTVHSTVSFVLSA